MRFLLILAMLTSLSAAGVHAQKATHTEAELKEAKAAFDAGTKAYAEGDFPIALERFNRAYALTDSPDLLFNIATVSDRMRRDDEALEAYVGYLEARPNTPDREHVEGRIKVCLLYTSPSPRDRTRSRMPSSA